MDKQKLLAALRQIEQIVDDLIIAASAPDIAPGDPVPPVSEEPPENNGYNDREIEGFSYEPVSDVTGKACFLMRTFLPGGSAARTFLSADGVKESFPCTFRYVWHDGRYVWDAPVKSEDIESTQCWFVHVFGRDRWQAKFDVHPQGTTDITPVAKLHGTGFLWKPVSENEGKLVVLTPGEWGDAEARIGNERLRFTGHANPWKGTLRGHYRGKQPGAAYPADTVLEVADRRILIPDPARRYE
jgi:hypothetical protein